MESKSKINKANQLADAESKYHSLFNNMFDEVHHWQLVRDDNGNIKTWRLIDINPAAERSWGKTRLSILQEMVALITQAKLNIKK